MKPEKDGPECQLDDPAPARADRPFKILVVDDSRSNCVLLQRLFGGDGYLVETASDGAAALDAIARDCPDIVLLDIMMPDIDGLAVCRHLKSDAATRLIPIILMTGASDEPFKILGIEAGADEFVTKPFCVPELRARVRSLTRLKRFTDDLESAETLLLTLAQTIEARDPCTEGHCQRLARYAEALGLSLGLGASDLVALRQGAFVHDIGKIGIPDAVLFKTGALGPREVELMRRHTIIGDELCRPLRSMRPVRSIIRHHHERLDGSGYPDGLEGDDIPLLAQITHVVDVFDALTTPRPYKPAYSSAKAIDELHHEGELGWIDRNLVEAFVSLWHRGEFIPHVRH